MLLKIKASNAQVTDVEVADGADTTVGDLKVLIEAQLAVPAAQQRLIFKGRILKDHESLEGYAITDGQTIHLVKGSAGTSPAAGTSAAAPPAAAPPAATPFASPFASPFGAPPDSAPGAANPFAMMQGLPGMDMAALGRMGMSGFGGMGGMGGAPPNMAHMQDELMRNPAAMQQIMNRWPSTPLALHIYTKTETLSLAGGAVQLLPFFTPLPHATDPPPPSPLLAPPPPPPAP